MKFVLRQNSAQKLEFVNNPEKIDYERISSYYTQNNIQKGIENINQIKKLIEYKNADITDAEFFEQLEKIYKFDEDFYLEIKKIIKNSDFKTLKSNIMTGPRYFFSMCPDEYSKPDPPCFVNFRVLAGEDIDTGKIYSYEELINLVKAKQIIVWRDEESKRLVPKKLQTSDTIKWEFHIVGDEENLRIICASNIDYYFDNRNYKMLEELYPDILARIRADFDTSTAKKDLESETEIIKKAITLFKEYSIREKGIQAKKLAARQKYIDKEVEDADNELKKI